MERLKHTSIIAFAVLLGLGLPSARAALIPLNSGDGIGELNNLTDANPVQGINCSAGPVGCTPGNVGSFNLTALHLSAGPHTLTLEAYQRGGSPFGVMYQGSITSTPEPVTLALIGTGLLGLGLFRRRKQA